jgi:uncharacterized membrane protein (DUF2068 family)
MQQRPTVITVLAILAFITGGFHFLMSFLAMAIGSQLTAMAASVGYVPPALKPAYASMGNLGFWIGLIGMAAALFTLFAGAGLWTLKRWGWWLALIGVGINLVTHLVAAIQGAITPASIVGALLNIAVIIYLFRPPVRQAFSGFSIDAPTAPQ